jgi:predicted Rossmann fold nucleotide-binding protein DprA/Smf involved in DNA uptake
LNADEKAIYDCLSNKPVHIEEIIAGTKLTPGGINAGLISLRLKGLIRQLSGSMFLRH